MLRIGLTGSIAAGKSTVSQFFQERGVALWDADQAARDVVQPGKPALGQIAEAFGGEMLKEDGQLNRKKLGALVFGDGEQLARLNAITHPFIYADMAGAIKAAEEREESIIVLDIPLLCETGRHREMDLVCLVYCEDEIRRKRLMERDGLSWKEADKRMASQMPQEEKRALADWVIDNSGSRADTLNQAALALDAWRTLVDEGDRERNMGKKQKMEKRA